jgi:hypothetical protein
VEAGIGAATGPRSPRSGRNWTRWVVLTLLFEMLAVGATCSVAGYHWFVPPHTWRGWVDRQRLTPPAWQPRSVQDNGASEYAALPDLLPEGWPAAWTAAQYSAIAGPGVGTPGGETPGLRRLVDEHAAALAALHEGGLRRCASTRTAALDASDSTDDALSACQKAAVLGETAARLYRDDGRVDDALRTLDDVIALGVNLDNGESLDRAVRGQQIAREACAWCVDLARDSRASSAALRAHAERVRELRGRLGPVGDTLCYEAARVDAVLAALARSDKSATRERLNPARTRLQARAARARVGASRLWVRDRQARLIAEAGLPPRERRFADALLRAERDVLDRDDELARLGFGPSWLTCVLGHTSLEAWLAGSETVAALELYRRQEDAYPRSLAGLVPAYLPHVPLDSFGGGPMAYQPVADGYVLSSAGPSEGDGGVHAETEARCGPDLPFVDDRPYEDRPRLPMAGGGALAPTPRPQSPE